MIKVVTYNGTFTFKTEKELDDWYDRQPEHFRLSSVIRIEQDDDDVPGSYTHFLKNRNRRTR